MGILKKHFKTKWFGDVLGYNSGISLTQSPPVMTAWCYLLDGVMIDTGIHHLKKSVVENALKDRPDFVLVTHYHEDHSANAGALKQSLGIPVYGHDLTIEKLKTPFKIRPYQHLMWGKGEPVQMDDLKPLFETKTCRIRPVHTPGHSADHTVYLEENRGYLFSGDMYLGERIKFFRADEVIGDQIESLKTILTLDFDALFCAHRPTLTKGKEVIRNKLDFLENFCGTVKDLHSKGMDVNRIIRQLDRKHDRFAKWLTLNNVSFANMVRSAYDLF